jgi:hypothetical protein
MHVAAGIGYDWGVKALLDAHADPSIKDKMDRSVVEYAEQKKKWSCVEAIRDAQRQRDEVARTAASQAIDKDDAQELYEVLQEHAKGGRIDPIIDKLYDGFKGRSCLDRYRRHKPSLAV